MNALSIIGKEYESSDSFSGSEEENQRSVSSKSNIIAAKRVRSDDSSRISGHLNKLPLPKDIKLLNDDDQTENTLTHNGRKRTFAHVEGNWSTFVYVKMNLDEIVPVLKDILDDFNKSQTLEWFCNEDFHLTLSKTFVIPYHSIHPFINELQSKLRLKSSMLELSFEDSEIKVYTNDEKTRTFLGIELTGQNHIELNELVACKINPVVTDYGCEPYYQNASYHVTIAWSVGNQTKWKNLKNLVSILESKVVENLTTYKVKNISCKTGNKLFNISIS